MTTTTDRKETEIGMIPQEWEVLKLGEISKFRQGLQVPLEDQSLEMQEGMIRFIRIVDYTKNGEEQPRYIRDSKGNFHVGKQDIIMIRYGSQTAGKVITGYEGIIANNMFKIEIDESVINPKYLYRYLSDDSIYQKLNNSQGSSTMPALTFGIVGNLLIPVPPLPEQKAIATTLGSIDNKIELLREQNKTLEAMGQAMFKSWFVDFDGVTEFEDSELGQIPKGWRVGKLGDFINISGGLAYKAEFLDKGKNILLTMGSVIPDGRFNFNGYRYYDGPYNEKNLLNSGDLILATRDVTQDRRLIGAIAMIPPNLECEKIIGGTNVYIVKNLDIVGNNFLYHLFKSDSYRNWIIGASKGTTVIMIVKDDILNFRFPIPDDSSFLDKFEKNTSQLTEKINNNNDIIQSLTQTRDNLLPRLMSGKMRVI